MELFLYQNDERIGPYTLEELQGWLDSGEVSGTDAAWFEGCTDWVTVRGVPGIRVPNMTGHALDADLVPPFEAYQGDEPCIFVSYSHRDCAVVFEEIQRFHDAGYKIWYDEGIDAGNEWPEEIAQAVVGCSLFLFFVSPRSVDSVNCRNEVNLALNEKKRFLAIHLEETELPLGLRLRMGDLQAILRYKLPGDRYQKKAGTMLDQLLGKTPPKSKKKAPAVQQSAPSNEIEPVARIGQSDAALSVREPAKPRPKGLAVALASLLLVACCIGGYLLYEKGGDVADETSRTDTTTATFPPGKHYLIPSVSMEMIRCEPGTFMMGSPENEEGRERDHQDRDETQHQVTLTKAFHLGKYEVTQAQWAKVMGNNPSKNQGDDLPVEMITWNEIMEFCKQLTWMEQSAGRLPEGYVYTLPTEAQWEYACRAGTTSPYSFGTRLTKEHANIDKSVGKTVNVGKYPPNAWGFHDMHGNVSERVLDWFGDYPKGAVVDPTGPRFGSKRPIRGGCFIWNVNLRSAYRRGCDEDLLREYLGFRLCLKKTQAPKADEQPTPGKPWTVPTVDLEMLWCKPGTFMMGSPEDEYGRNLDFIGNERTGGDYDETLHQVTLTKGFYLGKYEVTQAQWTKVMGENPSEFKEDRRPVGNVSWDDIMEFCKQLTHLEKTAGRLPEGYAYTLPTEAQWEYACRAGTTSPYTFGVGVTAEQANWNPTGVRKAGETKVVGTYPANAWGFHEMPGNAMERVRDWYGPYPKDAVKDPTGPKFGSKGIGRGGSCWGHVGNMRSAYRDGSHEPDKVFGEWGFRLSLQAVVEETK